MSSATTNKASEESQQQQPESSRSATQTHYRVQVRRKYSAVRRPLGLPDGPVTKNWRTVDFKSHIAPVIRQRFGSPEESLMTYPEAMKAAWTLIAYAESLLLDSGLQCRLLAVQLETSWKQYILGVVDAPVIEQSYSRAVDLVSDAPGSPATAAASSETSVD